MTKQEIFKNFEDMVEFLSAAHKYPRSSFVHTLDRMGYIDGDILLQDVILMKLDGKDFIRHVLLEYKEFLIDCFPLLSDVDSSMF